MTEGHVERGILCPHPLVTTASVLNCALGDHFIFACCGSCLKSVLTGWRVVEREAGTRMG